MITWWYRWSQSDTKRKCKNLWNRYKVLHQQILKDRKHENTTELIVILALNYILVDGWMTMMYCMTDDVWNDGLDDVTDDALDDVLDGVVWCFGRR